ncbi:hypothetical protein A4D02_32795 [Niastella koreensis]|uniref:TonB-dependent receptor n=2 Tax=Niastella koreensis TaxID=354356 RepID=G8T7G7_NIAKG|nr:TonB-dependent receptor [Niastella koreensis]AEW01203.1 TonB-dependent receptor [Niastella koreensis GR20-10]OQP45971.1 hypothetical protein A4D02_32795 [Niastella koreensis]
MNYWIKQFPFKGTWIRIALTKLLLIIVIMVSIPAIGQQAAKKVTGSFTETPLQQVFASIEQQTGYVINYSREEVNSATLVTVHFQQATIKEALQQALKTTRYTYVVDGYIIIIKARVKTQPLNNNGTFTGQVLDEESGEPVVAATIKIAAQATVKGSIDGTFSIPVPAGTYMAVISCVGYDTKQVSEIVVNANETVTLTLTLKRQKGQLQGVVVTANVRKESVAGLYARQKNNAALTDGISAEQIARTPDKNIGESLKRISGISTVENKYVVVRGLSERYNGAVLNGQLMPSTELNRKNFNFDILPVNMVDNVVVIKTLTPDRGAEFGGGLIEVTTLDIPTHNFLSISAGTSINDQTTGKPFLSLKLDGREYYGSVAKSRQLFGKLNWKTGYDAAAVYNAKSNDPTLFTNDWGITSMKAPVSQNYQLSLGKVWHTKDQSELGLLAAGSYRNTLNRQKLNTGRDGWSAASDGGGAAQENLFGADARNYDFSTNIAGMLGLGYRNQHQLISFQSLFIRTLNQQLALVYDGTTDGGNQWGMYDNTTQTTLLQNQLKGEYKIGTKGIKINWLGSYTWLEKQRPDNHQLVVPLVNKGALNPDSNNVTINGAGSTLFNGALRWWSRAVEKNYNWNASVQVPFTVAGTRQLFKGGYAGWSKDRKFFVLNASSLINAKGYQIPLTSAFSPEYLKSISFEKFGDSMHKIANLHALYGMLDNKLTTKLRLVWGLRAEYYNIGKVNGNIDKLEKTSGKDYSSFRNREKSWQLFPSANLTYSLNPKMNLRLAYARSIIRPDLRELSYFDEYDYELGGEYISGLVRSTILHHYDFRYEWYPAAGDIISFSAFFKKLDYPMEIYKYATNRLYSLKNAKEAQNYGIEMEARKSLAFTGIPIVKYVTLYGNFAYMDSRVKTMDLTYDNTNANKPALIEVVHEWEKRPQVGASNYTYNAGFFFDYKFLSASLVYNAVANRLFRVIERSGNTSTAAQSLYEQPVKSLDAQLAARFLKQQLEVKLNAGNLLNSFYIVYANRETPDDKGNLTNKQARYQKDTDLVDYKLAAGRTFGVTVSYTLK